MFGPRKRAHLVLIAMLAAALRAQDPEPEAAPAQQEQPAQEQPAQEQPRQEQPQQEPQAQEQRADDAPDGTDFAQTDGYRALLKRAMDHAPGLATDPDPVDLDIEKALAAPSDYRGKRVRVRGLLGDWWPERLRVSVRGTREVYRGVVTSPDLEQGVAFDALKPLTGMEPADRIEVEGIFYRTVTFEVKKGTTRTLPWVIAREVLEIEPDAAAEDGIGAGNLLFLSVMILAVAWFVFRLAQVARGARRRAPHPAGAGFRAMFHQRLARDRAKQHKKH